MPAKYISRQAEFYINAKTYRPDRALDEAAKHLPEIADAETKPGSLRHLGYHLGIDHATISRIRNKHTAFTPYVVLAILELTGWTLEQFKQYAGIKTILRG